MAAISKTTNVLNINFADNADNVTTWKINDPIDNITLSQVTTALADMHFTGPNVNLFVGSNGNELVRIKSVEKEQVVKTVEQIL